MRKVFLYLYPIEEFTKMFLFHDDSLYDEWGIERPLPILNNAINKRYREKDIKWCMRYIQIKNCMDLKKRMKI